MSRALAALLTATLLAAGLVAAPTEAAPARGGFVQTTWKLGPSGAGRDRVRATLPTHWSVHRYGSGRVSLFDDDETQGRLLLVVDPDGSNPRPKHYLKQQLATLAADPTATVVKRRSGRVGPDHHPYAIVEVRDSDSTSGSVKIYAWVGQHTSTRFILRMFAAASERHRASVMMRSAIASLELLKAP